MSINLKRAVGVVLVLVGTLMIATMAEAKEFTMRYSGWGVSTKIDLNEDLRPAVSSTYEGTGTFGKSTSNMLGELALEFSFDDSCSPGVIIELATTTMVTRYQNGDLIFFVLDDPEYNPSTVCFSFATDTGYFTLNLLITGGTGRFEGATGWAIMTTVMHPPLAWEPDGSNAAHSAFSGSLEGEIFQADKD